MKKLLQSLFILLFVATTAMAQNRTITGTVTSKEDNLPVPGVSVKVQGSNIGVSTAADGKFRLPVSSTATALEFTSIGFASQTIAIGSANVINVSLEASAKNLDEVVVTALGIQRTKKSTGYSNESISAKEITEGKVVNLVTGLQSKVSGLQISLLNNGVNPSTRVILRGSRSLKGDNSALIVIDGVPVPSSVLSALNPNDVESVNVLKGATAAALYGSEGVNGVLIVSTKKGEGKTKVNFSSTTSIETVAYLPNMQYEFGNGYDLNTYVEFENTSWGPKFDGSTKQIGPTLVDGSKWEIPYSPLKDEKMKFWDKGLTFQNDLSFSGGDATSKFFLSFQDVKITGVLPKDESRRTGVRFNGAKQFGKFDISANLNFALNTSDVTTSSAYDDLLNIPQQVPLTQLQDWENNKFATPDGYFSGYYINPYWGIDNRRRNTKGGYFTGNVEANYKFTDWLKATYRLGLYNRTSNYKQFGAKVTYTTLYDRPSNSNGSVTDYADLYRRLNSDLILQANKKFGDFDFGVLVGNNIRDIYSTNVSAGATALVVPGLYNVSNRVGEATVSSTYSKNRMYAFFGEFNASYKDYLFLNVTGRNEAVSLLSSDNRSYFYPGASLSFVFTDAVPTLKSDVLSSGKVFASANKTGNVNLNPYSLETTLSQSSGFPYGNNPGFTVGNTYANSNLTPEFVKSFETGVQLGFFKSRVNLDATYAYSKAEGQIVAIATSGATGYTNAFVNSGRVDNNIIELGLRATPVRNSNITWDLGINYTHYDNKVVELYQGLDEIGLGGYTNAAYVFAVKGQQYPVVKTTAYERDPEGRVVVNASGNPIRAAALKVQGQSNPDQTLGFNTRVAFKGFTLAGQLDYRTGNVIYSALGRNLDFTGLSAHSAVFGREPFVVPNSVIKNPNGTYTPNTTLKTAEGGFEYWYSQYSQVQENYTVDATFLKLREVSLTYSLPNKFLAKQKVVKAASVGLVGRNLFTKRAKDNVFTDPEFNFDSGNATGIEDQINPPTRIYGFTLNVSF